MSELHKNANIGLGLGSTSCSKILCDLFAIKDLKLGVDTPCTKLDFNEKDENGMTCIHLAQSYCADRVTNQYVFPRYVEEAVKQGFDFDILNAEGLSVLHQAAISQDYTGHLLGFVLPQRDSLSTLLEKVPNINLNQLSAAGGTAFYYALSNFNIDKAITLLKYGADPRLYGHHGSARIEDNDIGDMSITDLNPSKALEKLETEIGEIKDVVVKRNLEQKLETLKLFITLG